ncbi:hypothetical protein MCEMKE14_00999 [Candidatus Nanopelagicaceae bacterium]
MHGYLAITPDELAELIKDGEISIETAFIPTNSFKAANSDLGEEESEYILSLLAADDSLSYQDETAKFSFALAVDLEDSQIGSELDVEVNLTSPVRFSQADCLFVGEVNSEEGELTWYAAQEIALHLPGWQA